MYRGKHLVALCTSRIYDPHIIDYIDTLNNILNENNCSMLIFTINSDLYWKEDNLSAESAVFDIIPYDKIDAVIIMDERIKSSTVTKRIISRARKYDLPTIIVDGHYNGSVSINFDYESGFEKVVRHVIEEHHVKRPHMIAGIPGNPFSDRRIDVFKKVLGENGITFDDSMVSYGLFWAVPAREATEELLKREEMPDAIICANDIMAINVCDVLKNAGVSIPQQVIVTGFDGYDEVFFSMPKITTVSCNCHTLSEATGETVIKCISGEKTEDVYISPELILNESCGCPSNPGYRQAIMNRFNDGFYRYQDDLRGMNDIATKMQSSKTPKHMAESLNNDYMTEMFCVVKKKCLDFDSNILLSSSDSLSGNSFCIIYDSHYPNSGIRKARSAFPVHWDENKLNEFFEQGYPLIYNALDYMNKPLGYVCYSYKKPDITNYVKTSSITNTLSMGLGGFINMRYQKKLASKVNDMYIKDTLTGLYNRNGFNTIYAKIKNSRKNQGKTITVIMSDLDGLKYINDNFGHAEGDKAIATAAHALKKACPNKAVCVRFGGDELFAVIIDECDTESIINKIYEILNDYNIHSGLSYSVVASCGANTSVLDKNFDIKDALRIADEQMYEIKRKRK